MTNERTIPTSPRKRDSELRSWLLSLLATVLTFAFFWYGFRTRPPTVKETVTEAQSSCQFVGSWENHDRLADWERMLHIWARLADPTVMVLPDEQLGFSRVRQTKRALPETPVPEYGFRVILSKEATFPGIRLAAPPHALPDEMRLRWTAALPELPPAPTVVPLPEGIVWHRPDGRVLMSMPELDLERVRKAISEGGRPRYPTRVELRAGSAETPTRIRVRRASGNVQLDLHVVSALRRDVGAYERKKRYLAAAAERPAYLPPPGASILFEIEWSLFSTELSPED